MNKISGDTEERPGVKAPPPLWFFLCLGAGLVAQYFFPLALLTGMKWLRFSLAALTLALAGGLAYGAFFIMARLNTPYNPAKSVRTIVTQGVFRYSRNPMYLSLILVLTATALASGSVWLFLAVVLLYVLLRYLAIAPEEAYLAGKFGDDYLDYKARVRRWI